METQRTSQPLLHTADMSQFSCALCYPETPSALTPGTTSLIIDGGKEVMDPSSYLKTLSTFKIHHKHSILAYNK